MTENGLDLDFTETKKSLNIPVAHKGSGYKYQNKEDELMFEGLRTGYREMDYQQFLTRFKWNNLPEGLRTGYREMDYQQFLTRFKWNNQIGRAHV